MWSAGLQTRGDRKPEVRREIPTMEADATLDTVGLYCPMPIVKTASKMKELQAGQVLEVVSDDPGIKKDMPAWCHKTGNELVGMEERDGVFHVFVRKQAKRT